MILIVGGAYQGKTAYARDILNIPASRIVPQLELTIRTLMDAGLDPEREIARLADGWTDACVLLADISCGVVPMDPADRAWREAVGRCGAYLARRANKVVRVFCGLGSVLKDA